MANSVNSILILNELMVGAAIKGKVNPYVSNWLKAGLRRGRTEADTERR